MPLPGPLRRAKITNPDAPLNNHYITVVQNGRSDGADAGAVFQSRPLRRGPRRHAVRLSGIQADGAGERRWTCAARRSSTASRVLFDPGSVPGFAEQIGRNTKYIIHPEEILADNFVFLINGRIDLPSPRVVEEMGQMLQGNAGRPHAGTDPCRHSSRRRS